MKRCLIKEDITIVPRAMHHYNDAELDAYGYPKNEMMYLHQGSTPGLLDKRDEISILEVRGKDESQRLAIPTQSIIELTDDDEILITIDSNSNPQSIRIPPIYVLCGVSNSSKIITPFHGKGIYITTLGEARKTIEDIDSKSLVVVSKELIDFSPIRWLTDEIREEIRYVKKEQ